MVVNITPSKSAQGAADYFTKGLAKDDYYTKGSAQEVVGQWHGKAAKLLGMSGDVSRDDFVSLVHNIYQKGHPKEGQKITGRQRKDRRPGYDITFNLPKSASLLFGLTNDQRIVEAFQRCARDAMTRIEKDMKVQVKTGGQNGRRVTANMIWGEFTHFTSRPTKESEPDPHLHIHCYAINVTHDEVENKWKAGEYEDVYHDKGYHIAAFHADMARAMRDLGYEIRQTGGKGAGWEVAHISDETIQSFSRRTKEIEALKKKLEKDYGRKLTDKEKADLAGYSRGAKSQVSMKELRDMWNKRLSKKERSSVFSAMRGGKSTISMTADSALGYAIRHSFENVSAIESKKLQQTALRYGLGHLNTAQITQAYQNKQDHFITGKDKSGRVLHSTKDVYAEEQRMFEFARLGKGACSPLNPNEFTIEKTYMNEGQRNAVAHVLRSNDRVIMVEGRAGVGKTTSMQETVRGLIEAGQTVGMFAPNGDGVKAIKEDGKECLDGVKKAFESAHTVARLLVDKELQDDLNGGVIIVDEAGMVSIPQMCQLFEVAKEQNARIVLSGDTKQFASVERGDAMHQLKIHAGLPAAEITEIMRQKVQDYKEAVQDVANDNIKEGMRKLDALGAIEQYGDVATLHNKLAKDYLEFVQQKHLGGKAKGQFKTAVIQAPTHKEGLLISDQIRSGLREIKDEKGKPRLGSRSRSFQRLKNLNMSRAERQDFRNFMPGQVIHFHQNCSSVNYGTCQMMGYDSKGNIKLIKQMEDTDVELAMIPNKGPAIRNKFKKSGITRGTKLEILGHDEHGNVWAKDKGGNVKSVPIEHSERFNVYEQLEIKIAKGEQLRITNNGRSKEGKKLINNEIWEVEGFKRNGDIKLKMGKRTAIIDGDFGHFTYGYAVTRGQGLTRDAVFIGESSMSFKPANMKQFYVGVSRGREMCRIYTDDKDGLLRAVSDAGGRMSATDLLTRQVSLETLCLANKNSTPRETVELGTYEQRRDDILSRNKSQPWIKNPDLRRLDWMITKDVLTEGWGRQAAYEMLGSQGRDADYIAVTVENASHSVGLDTLLKHESLHANRAAQVAASELAQKQALHRNSFVRAVSTMAKAMKREENAEKETIFDRAIKPAANSSTPMTDDVIFSHLGQAMAEGEGMETPPDQRLNLVGRNHITDVIKRLKKRKEQGIDPDEIEGPDNELNI